MGIIGNKSLSMEPKITHYLYCPLLGLGLYGGHRGARWLRNRIKIFKQFVIPSLQAQTSKNFILWISVRHQDRYDADIIALKEYMESIAEFRTFFTHSGVCFWDDKYSDAEARDRLAKALHGSLAELMAIDASSDFVYMTIQPSDDCYHKEFVEQIQKMFVTMPDIQVLGFKKGYVMDYKTLDVAEWNPDTIPPFFTIKFPASVFIEPWKHIQYTGPYKSHEYIGDKLKMGFIEERGFIVGTHGLNISTVFNHPFTGKTVDSNIRDNFGLLHVQKLVVPFRINNYIFMKLPYGVKRKLRYWATEKEWIFRTFFGAIYNILRA